jgi:virginiamycin B lyase
MNAIRTLSRAAGAHLLALVLVLGALAAPRAEAARIQEWSIGKEANGIAVDPDGAIHFIQSDWLNQFGDSPSGGALIDGASYLQWVASGPSWLWLIDAGGNKVWRYPHVVGQIKAYTVPTPSAGLFGGAVGADGNLWFTEFSANKIGRVTPAGVFTEFPLPTAGAGPLLITAAEDGRLYFSEKLANKLGRIATDGTIEEFPMPTASSQPAGVAADGGTVCVVESSTNKIALFNIVSSSFSEWTLPPGSQPWGAAGGRGTFFVTEAGTNKIGYISGGYWVEVDIPTPSSKPFEIAVDHRGRVLFSEHQSQKIGMLELSAPGDVNADGNVDVGDIFYLINFLFAGGGSPK